MAKYKYLQANVEMSGFGTFGKVPNTKEENNSSCECEKKEEENKE